MKKIFFTLFILINITNMAIAQSNKINTEDFCKEWILQKGWFTQEEIVLEKKDIKKHISFSKQFIFKNNGKLEITIYNPQRMGLCGNGQLRIEKAIWSFIDNQLTIDIKGSHRYEDEFHYKIVYVVTINENILILKKVKTLIDEFKQDS